MSRGEKRRFQVTLTGDVADQVRAWALTMGFEPGQDYAAARMLIEMGMAATPQEGMMTASMRNAFAEVYTWTTRRLMQALAEVRDQLHQTLAERGLSEKTPP